MGLKGGKKSTTKKDSTMDMAISVNDGDTQQRTLSQQQQCATTVDSGDTWLGRVLKRKKGSKEKEKARETTREREMAKQEKVGGKGNNLQTMSECDEWDQNDEYCCVPILSLERWREKR